MHGRAHSPWYVTYVIREICTLMLLVYNTHWLSDVFMNKTHLTACINIFRLLFYSFHHSCKVVGCHHALPPCTAYYGGDTQNKTIKNGRLFVLNQIHL